MNEQIFQSIEMSDGLQHPVRLKIHGEQTSQSEAVVIVPGFKGFATWGFFPWLAHSLVNDNQLALRVDFSHNGIGDDQPEEFTRLDLFAKHTFRREIQEIIETVRWLKTKRAIKKVTLLGHSRGGGTSLLAALESPVDRVITLAGIESVHRFDQQTIDVWKRNKVLMLLNGRTNQEMPMNIEILEEVENDPEYFDILNRSKNIQIPTLHIHSEDDPTVNITAAHLLAKATGGEVKTLPSGEHTFGAGHPFKGPTEELDKTLIWVKEFLNSPF